MGIDGPWSSRPHHRTENEGDDDHVIGVAEDRDEVGDEVERQGEVRQQQAEAPTNSGGKIRVRSERPKQSDEVGDEPLGFLEVDPLGPEDHQCSDEHRPRQTECDDDPADGADDEHRRILAAWLPERLDDGGSGRTSAGTGTSSVSVVVQPAVMPNFVRLLAVLTLAFGAFGAFGACGGEDAGGPSAESGFGPLAVRNGPPTGDEALVSGTIEITDTCVFLTSGDERSLLVWPSEGTEWDDASRTIRYSAEGTVELRDGDSFRVAGSGSSEAESGLGGRAWAASIPWVAEPDPACVTSTRHFVGSGPEE